MNARQLDTILAALRIWQGASQAEANKIARQHGPALDAEEIDQLVALLNAGQLQPEPVRKVQKGGS